jgi:hypothetical protein
VTGRATLVFTPDSGPDDPAVQFIAGGRTLDFRVTPGSTQAVFTGASGIQTGTVAGNITITTRMQAGGVDITPAPVPAFVMRVEKGAPFIVSANLVKTADGFDMVINGYATSREVASATIHFNPAPGVNLPGTDATVALSPVFTTWYQDAASAKFGSQFTLRIPFFVRGVTNPIVSATVVLSNAQGNSILTNTIF